MMRVLKTEISGVSIIETGVFEDSRGFFKEIYQRNRYADAGITGEFVQDNLSQSCRGTLRGMHYQLPPRQETKLVRCIRGSLVDVILDLRENSHTFGEHLHVELSANNRHMFYVPKGFAHGFITLEDDTEVLYFVDEYYRPELERAVRWNDPRFGIQWPMEPTVVSDKDAAHPNFDPSYHLPD